MPSSPSPSPSPSPSLSPFPFPPLAAPPQTPVCVCRPCTACALRCSLLAAPCDPVSRNQGDLLGLWRCPHPLCCSYPRSPAPCRIPLRSSRQWPLRCAICKPFFSAIENPLVSRRLCVYGFPYSRGVLGSRFAVGASQVNSAPVFCGIRGPGWTGTGYRGSAGCWTS